MAITRAPFGKLPDGTTAELFTITNAQGAILKVTNYGGTIVELHMPDKQGKLANVVLGFRTFEEYLKNPPYFGVTVGRFANRIAKGSFSIRGKSYTLPKNDHGINTLHGGTRGFNSYLWDATLGANTVTLKMVSPDGDQGFPGTLHAMAGFSLTHDNEVILTFGAQTDAPTPVNLCNHAYYNLAGAGNGNVLGHTMYLNASRYTPVDDLLIPTGEIAPVAGTPLDFTRPQTIGARIGQLTGGYDHNFVIDHPKPGDLTLAATARDPVSGRVMDVLATQPAVQLYTGNFLDETLVGNGGRYGKHGGLCLETQHFPDSPNRVNFPDTILLPGQKYAHKAVHRFRTI
jgi:aldose 1-epimerase